jgi:UDP-N-acetylmuramyl pentapeptide synthase
VIEFESVESAMTAIRNFLKPGDVVLLKASRASRLERIAGMLKSEKP